MAVDGLIPMQFGRVLLIAVIAALATPVAALAHSKKHNLLDIQHPWTRESADRTAVVKMSIRNSGQTGDRLIAVVCKDAGSAGIHPLADPQTAGAGKVDGGADIKTAAAGIELPAHSVTKFEAVGPFIELTGLKRPLTAYDRIPLTLTFETAGSVEIEVMVEPDEN